MTTHRKTCSICEALCGLLIEVEDDKVKSIRGNPDDVFSEGYLCPKGVALQDLHNDPNRLRAPVRRVGQSWEEIGWDEALNEVADKLTAVREEHGRESVGVYLGNPNVHHYSSLIFGPALVDALHGKRHFSATSADQLPHMFAAFHMFGHQLMIPIPDVNRTAHMVIIGGNPAASNGSLMTAPNMAKRLKRIRKRGGKVVVIDPRQTETAKLADDHHFIRPGTDAVFLLAWLNVLVEEIGIQPGVWQQYTDGLDVIRALATRISPEKAETVCGIPADTIRTIVTEATKASSSAVYGRIGVCTQRFGGLGAWLINVINILSGRLDVPGGVMFTKPAVDFLPLAPRGHYDIWRSRVRGLPEFGGELPVSTLAEEMDTPGDGQIRAFLTIAGNPVLSSPNGSRLERALPNLDFMVCIDPYINETTRHANIILPPTSPLERDHYGLIFHGLAIHNTAKYSEALFEPPPNAKHDWQIAIELGEKLLKRRQDRDLPARSMILLGKHTGPKRLLDVGLRTGPYGSKLNPFGRGLTLEKLRNSKGGVDLGPLEPCLPKRLFTEDKRVVLAPQVIVQDVERLARAVEDGDLTPDGGEFLLIGRRQLRSNNSWLHNSERLMRGKKRCTLMLHPNDAKHRNIENGTMVRVTSRVGAIEVEVEVTDTIMPGVVSIPHGWGHGRKGVQLDVAQRSPGVSINDLTDEEHVDVLSGNAGFSGVRVQVKAITP